MSKFLNKIFPGKKNASTRGEYLGRPPYDYCSNSLGDLTADNTPIQPASSLSSFHAGLSSGSTSSSNQQYHRNAPHDSHTSSDRYRHHSTEDDGAGVTDEFVFRGAGALSLVTNGNRRISDGGSGGDGLRRNEMGAEPRSPTSKKPIVMDDYSDPKDVLKAVQESGMVIPPQKPEMVQPYPEDDYSVPYEAQRMIKMMRQSEEQKKGEGKKKEGKKGSRHTDDPEGWSVPKGKERFKHHTYEEPPDVSPPIRRSETPDSYVGESSDELNGHSPASMSPSPHRQVNYSKDHHSSSPMSSESADDTYPPLHSSSQNHRQQTPQHDRRPTAEYDNPWEWSNMRMAKHGPSPEGLEGPRGRSRSELPANRVMRTSPESDTRPGDEYDAPWEWMPMNRKLSQAITDKEKHHAGRVSPLPETPTRGAKKGNMKLDIKSRPVEMPGEPVDPNIPLNHQTWYHGKLSRSDAEKKLKLCVEGSYLVRQSESAARDYSLSLKSAKGFMHMKIVFNHQSDGYILGEFSKPFPSISEMICYYTRQKLNIRGAEHMALLHPVIDQLL